MTNHKYNHEVLIGSGRFGNVWLVKNSASAHFYVMKEINLGSMSETEVSQALTEVTILARCEHPNIISYKDAMYDKDLLCIVMEYAEGGDLYTVIAKQKGEYFEEDCILSWFIQICLALHYIHDKNILHRDLKSQNIFLTRDNLIKVGDFGISRVLKEAKELAMTSIGTPYYLSPEICKRKPYNYKSDIWALGCVLFEMASLVHPFQGHNFHQLVNMILKSKRRDLPSHCSPLIEYLVTILMKPSPDDRPSTKGILVMPALQHHIISYVSTNDVKLDASIIIALNEKETPRRSSENDILKDVDQLSSIIKRRSSIAECPEETKIKKPVSVEKSKIPSSPYRYRFALFRPSAAKNDKDTSSPTRSKSKIPISVKRRFARSYTIETSGKDECMKNHEVALQTYTLKDQLKDVEIAHSCDSAESSDILHSAETDCGYHSADTSKKLITAKHFDKTINKGSAFKMSSSCTTSNNSQVSASNDGGDTSVKLGGTSSAFISDETNIDCQHSFQCHQCVLDLLWKNRIRSDFGVRDTELSKLRNKLHTVFGKEQFQNAHSLLLSEWEDEITRTSKAFTNLVRSLTIDQVQYVPLLMQLIQVELMMKSEKEGS